MTNDERPMTNDERPVTNDERSMTNDELSFVLRLLFHVAMFPIYTAFSVKIDQNP